MNSPKGFGRRYFSLAAILAFSVSSTIASSKQSFNDHEKVVIQKKISKKDKIVNEDDPLVITKKIEVKEVDAPFASEIYTAKDIKNSHSKNLYDFLNTQTSLTVMPSFGNTFSQLIDLRGYGLANGYENVVITLNGRRLNNIDATPQLLSSIPIGDIKRIEIIKGSGSVEYGDGADGGVVNIITKRSNNMTVKTYAGSNGLWYGGINFGIKKNKFAISGYMDKTQYDGDRYIDTTGDKNTNSNENKAFRFDYNPINKLRLYVSKTFSKMDIFYPGSISLSQYEKNPKSIPAYYTHQYYWDNVLSYGFEYKISNHYQIHFDGNNENKLSEYMQWHSIYRYYYNSYNTRINYNKNNLKVVAGVQVFDGLRKKNSGDNFYKDNTGYYINASYKVSKNTISLGARREKIKYNYDAKYWNKIIYENAYNVGYNYKLNNFASLFANINRSFQAPDIDRFFTFNNATYTQYFNKYIKPMNVNNYNLGFNYFKYPHKLKLSIFYANVHNEIYYNTLPYPQNSYNTNLDRTRKYGFELDEKYNIHYNLFIKLNYIFTDTKILKDTNNPLIAGNSIPGVSKHKIKLAIGYRPNFRTTFLLSHIYRSQAYAMSDFKKKYAKMQGYNSTNLSVNYKYKKINLFAKVKNIFYKKNALFAYSGNSLGVYPVNYERTFMLGMSIRF